jgi:hypothetical protein
MAGNGRSVGDLDEVFAIALAGGATYAEAGALANRSERTVRRRMEDEGFRERVWEARRERVDAVRARVTTAGLRAVDQLVDLAETSKSDSVRLGAARSLAQMAIDLRGHRRELNHVSSSDVEKIATDMYELAMRALPEEMHARFAGSVSAYLDSGHL